MMSSELLGQEAFSITQCKKKKAKDYIIGYSPNSEKKLSYTRLFVEKRRTQ